MKILDRIEINYFRSIYRETLSSTNDINVLIGGNDAGKSNILKALNLFFNNTTDVDQEFDFLSDLSRLREEEVRVVKGRATIWIKVTFNNFLEWPSLPDKFTVKKSWNRYFDQPDITYDKDASAVSLGKFLNKISFHYIPAVRGRNIYSHYLELLHDALIDDERAGVREASGTFMQSVNDSTDDMSQKIQEGLAIESKIQVPEDLRDLFSAFDFSTVFEGHQIPLQLRGDGIQARHIPFILDFIARHSKRSHIWAYEEPENSLELSKAFDLASQFDNDFSDENQIFLTTHSPAFYDLHGENVSKWLVEPLPYGPNAETVTTPTAISTTQETDERLGIAALVSSRAKEIYEENKKLSESVKALEQDIRQAERPQIIVEGPSDKLILETALETLFPERSNSIDFAAAGGASKAAAFLDAMQKVPALAAVPVIAILDNDSEGRKQEAAYFKKYKTVEGTNLKAVNLEKSFYFGLLPIPEQFGEVDASIQSASGGDFRIPLPIEFMFPSYLIKNAVEEGFLNLEDQYGRVQNGSLGMKVNITANFQDSIPEGQIHFVQTIDESSKDEFSKWIAESGFEPDVFSSFISLFEDFWKVLD